MSSARYEARPTVIFIHGYYGSTLRDVATKRRVFLSAREILFGRNALSLHQEDLGTPKGPALEVEGMFGNVPVIPFFYTVDVYGNFVKALGELPGVQMVAMAYDWRQDLGLAVKQLDGIVEGLRAAGVKQIAIVAHSMGGLVTSYYLGYGAQDQAGAQLNWDGALKVSRAMFLGTPFGGAFGLYRNMQRGADFPWNRNLLPADAVSSFPASYALIPFEGAYLTSPEGQRIPVDLGSGKFWKENRLGFFARSDLSPAVAEAREKFTYEQLNKARQFMSLVNFRGQSRPLPAGFRVTNVQGTGRDTVDSAYFDQAAGEMIYDVDNPRKHRLAAEKLLTEGDGSVTLGASALPLLLAKGAHLIRSKVAHDRLFDDETVRSELKKLFTE